MKPVKTWILIADARKARVMENEGPGKGLYQLDNKNFQSDSGENFADEQGRTHNSTTHMRHKMGGNDRVDVELINYIDDVFSDLSTAFGRKEFDRLIVCAAPDTLGVMRSRIPDDLKKAVLADIAKDLTHIPTNELPAHFEEVLAV